MVADMIMIYWDGEERLLCRRTKEMSRWKKEYVIKSIVVVVLRS